MGWLLVDKLLRISVGLLVTVWLARYLGPEQFGILNYAIALVAIFGSIATLGLNGIVVRDLVQSPSEARLTLGSSFSLQLVGALLAVGSMLLAVILLDPRERSAGIIVAILGCTLILQSTSVIKYWFESQVESRYSVWIENGALLLMAGIKVAMIVNGAPLVAFAWAMLAESVIVAVGLVCIYAAKAGFSRRWHVSVARIRELLHASWPLMIAGIAFMIYLRVDQIMLEVLRGPSSVGIYSAALRITEVWSAVAVIFVSSVFPAIIDAERKSEAVFRARIQKLLNWLFRLALVMALLVTVAAEWIVRLLFGDAYLEAAAVLQVHIWAGIFVFMGHVGGKWYIIKNLQRLSMQRSLVGLVMNFALNVLLIPDFGATGAAVASLCTMFVVFYAYDAVNQSTRELFVMKTKSMLMLKQSIQ